jgi:hypothetical protein
MYKAMFDQVMRSLRWHVEQLEDQDMIETALQRRTEAVPETEPSATCEIDTMMEKMMGPRGQAAEEFKRDDCRRVSATCWWTRTVGFLQTRRVDE